MNSLSITNKKLASLLIYVLALSIISIGYNSLAVWVLVKWWPSAFTLTLLVAPIVTYLFLQRIANNWHQGELKWLILAFNGLILNLLAGVLIPTFVWLLEAVGLNVLNSDSTIGMTLGQRIVGYVYWYAQIGAISTVVSLLVLWGKKKALNIRNSK